ncbi:MAG: glycerophosphodiester phosphodiesterase [Rhodocyclaceae bacterium]
MKPWPYPRVIAHRCGGVMAPENTLAGLRAAARAGLRAVEFDVMLSADGTPFLIHDETLERTTDGQGRVAETHDAVLRSLDAGIRSGAEFAGERLPGLDEAIAACYALGLWANVEIKPARGHERQTGEVIARTLGALWRGEPPLVSSFSVRALEAARGLAPALPRALLVEDLGGEWRETAAGLGCVSIHTDAARLAPGEIEAVHEAGFWLAAYTVNDPGEARRLLDSGLDAIFTDRPDDGVGSLSR